MTDSIAISVQDVGKAYRMWENPSARLMAPLTEGLADIFPPSARLTRALRSHAAKRYRDFWALKNISFEVRKGEAVGIIGRNGSGKSTLLQIIAGTLQPTEGVVGVTGRVAALLELGSGFNPEFTGRENVYLNAAVLGLTRAETDARFDRIAAFAEIGDFLDQPVRTYSSGMVVRLAFSVASCVDPDILIVDEALSVGDAPFQAKCFARIRAIQAQGCSILLVSHDMGTVRTFCQKAVWLKQDVAMAQGEAPVVCDAYGRDCLRAMGMAFEESSPTSPKNGVETTDAGSSWRAEDRSEFDKLAAMDRHGDGPVKIRNCFLVNEKGIRTSTLRWDEQATAVQVLGSEAGYEGLFQVGFVCKTLQGQELLCCSDRVHSHRLRIKPGAEVVVTLRLRLPLRAGKYSVTTAVFLFPDDARFAIGTYDFTRATASDFINHASIIEIVPQFNLGVYGPVQQEAQLSLEPQ